MRFHVGRVPPDPDFHPEQEGWRRLQEPTDFSFVAQATVVGIGVAFAFQIWISSIPPTDASDGRIVIRPGDLTPANIAIAIGAIVGGFALLIVVHECIHLLNHPGNGRSRQSVVGVLPRWGAFYAFYGGKITRNRYVMMVAAPFVLISVIPATLFTFIGQPPVWAGLMIVVNGLCSGGDLAAIALVLRQLPGGTLIRHQSWEAYWKPNE